jgi:hypothetical protein
MKITHIGGLLSTRISILKILIYRLVKDLGVKQDGAAK